MSKFKVGDKVRCIAETSAIGVEVGGVYTVSGFSHFDTVVLQETGSNPYSNRLELVESDGVLTLEEVLQYFKEGRQDELECSSKVRASGWAELLPNEDMYVSQINERKWRVKQVPNTVDYYGTELPKPIDISKLDGITVVYVPQLHRNAVISMKVAQAKRIPYYDDALHFNTYEDAQLVLDTILKPFK